jgi:hypothetical protein
MMSFTRPQTLAPIALVLLAACGGGGGGAPTTQDVILPLIDPAATGSVTLAGVSLDSVARSTSGLTGTLNYTADTFSLGSISGDINSDLSQVEISGGGAVTLTAPSSTSFATLYDATPKSGNRTLGVVGAATPIAGMLSTGTATYTGTAAVTIEDNATRYDLAGNASVVASFGAGKVATTINALSGTQTTGATAPVKVTDAAIIGFTGSSITGATFSGGTPSLTSTTIAALSGAEQSSLDGAFFGPDADEAGAAFVIDDSASGTVTVLGTLIAD